MFHCKESIMHNFARQYFSSLQITVLLLTVFSIMKTSNAAGILLPQKATPVEKKAAEELQHYITAMTGKNAVVTSGKNAVGQLPVFYVRETNTLPKEAWSIKSTNDGVMLEGGGRGVLYAVYHYLEDVCGVSWLTKDAETVPQLTSLPVKDLNLSGKPALAVRDIPLAKMDDRFKNPFAARMRVNALSDRRISAEYGGSESFGSPYRCHTWAMYIPYYLYFKLHPEWYVLYEGKRFAKPADSTGTGQLCLSNKEMRKEVLKRLRGFIENDRKIAAENNIAAPHIYDISQDDNQRYCQCAKCRKIVAREGGRQSGLIIDFINEIATSIRKEYPDILISTFAYQYSEEPPLHIKPSDNVMMVVCDTRGNMAAPISDKSNTIFQNLLQQWSKLTNNLRVWDYASTYQLPQNLPVADEFFIADDVKTLLASNVTQYYPQLSIAGVPDDVGDYKWYLYAKFMEGPNQNFAQLSKRFTDSYYGPAGKIFRQYRRVLYESMLRKQPFVAMYPPGPGSYVHLDFDTVMAAEKLFDEGQKLIGDNPEKLRRWNHARLSLDRAALNLERPLLREHLLRGGKVENYPLNREEIVNRVRKTWQEHLFSSFGQYVKSPHEKQLYSQAMEEMEKELKRVTLPGALDKDVIVPEKFAKYPQSQVFDYTVHDIGAAGCTDLQKDPDSESTIAARIYQSKQGQPLEQGFKLPGKFEVFSYERWGDIDSGLLPFAYGAIPGPGYHWYKICSTTITPGTCLVLWNWRTLLPVGNAYDKLEPDARFDIWVRVKFTGPAYLGRGSKDENAIWLDRVVLVKTGLK